MTVRELPEFLTGPQRPASVHTHILPEVTTGRRAPGEPGLWVFIFGDMTLFGVFFVALVVQMDEMRDVWATSANQLHDDLGVANTVTLLVSSYLVARSVAQWHAGAHRRAKALMVSAAALGICFAAVKVSEYVLLLSTGAGPTENLFFTYYFVLTGIHLVHVGIGVVILLLCARRLEAKSRNAVEGSASYWHMVDVLWVVMFPLLYFVGRV